MESNLFSSLRQNVPAWATPLSQNRSSSQDDTGTSASTNDSTPPTLADLQAQLAVFNQVLAAHNHNNTPAPTGNSTNTASGTPPAATTTNNTPTPTPTARVPRSYTDAMHLDDFNDTIALDPNVTDLSGFNVVHSKAAREAASAADKVKIYSSFTRPPTQFKGFSSVEDALSTKNLQNVRAISKQLHSLEKHLASYDAQGVFLVPYYTPAGERIPVNVCPPDNLLQLSSTITKERVVLWCTDIITRGSPFVKENGIWSGTLLEACCKNDPAFAAAMATHLEKYPAAIHIGPLILYCILETLLSCDAQSLASILKEVTDMKLSDFPGDCVLVCTSQLRLGVTFLRNHNNAPPNPLQVAMKCLISCDNAIFIGRILHQHNELQCSNAADPFLDLLDFADAVYKTLRTLQWPALERASIFAADSTTPTAGGLHRKPPGGRNNPKGKGKKGRPLNWPTFTQTTPSGSDPLVIKFEGRTWYYCTKCRKWKYGPLGHLARDCPGASTRANSAASSPTTQPEPTTPETPSEASTSTLRADRSFFNLM